MCLSVWPRIMRDEAGEDWDLVVNGFVLGCGVYFLVVS
jgi:hypothetical protein